MRQITIATKHGRATFDPTVGNLPELTLVDAGQVLSPLHRAPWIGEALPDDLPPVERQLAGDFFCAPFGTADVEVAPPHGWSANSAWNAEVKGTAISARLGRRVMGATIQKRLRLSSLAPLLVQEHVLVGGSGALTVAHHPMVHLSEGGRFCCSKKSLVLSPDEPLEPGRNRLEAGASVTNLRAFPAAGGLETVDLTVLPIGTRHEDFVTLVEAPENALGWTAVLRDAEDDIVFVLKDPRILPVTMLWHSNAGRDYAPWNGRHRNVLGIEDGCAAGASGHRAALSETPVSRAGVPTALTLAPERQHRIVHVIGAIVRPSGWGAVRSISIDGSRLVLEGDTGSTRALPIEENLVEL